MIQTQISILPSTLNMEEEFSAWVTRHCNDTSIVLDVGAGSGRTKNPEYIRPHIARLVGVDPDATIERNPYLDERYQATLEDFAQNYNQTFDCLYARFVIEHVTNPDTFIQSCRSLLKPGGTLFGITPNLWHYFGLITKISSSMGIEDWLLDRLIGVQAKANYHFPTAYRLNSIPAIKHTLEQNGFREVEFKCFDWAHGFKYCIPRLLHWFPDIYSRLVYRLGAPYIMGHIMFKATA
jgi:SAM-dependent methyltransferase